MENDDQSNEEKWKISKKKLVLWVDVDLMDKE